MNVYITVTALYTCNTSSTNPGNVQSSPGRVLYWPKAPRPTSSMLWHPLTQHSTFNRLLIAHSCRDLSVASMFFHFSAASCGTCHETRCWLLPDDVPANPRGQLIRLINTPPVVTERNVPGIVWNLPHWLRVLLLHSETENIHTAARQTSPWQDQCPQHSASDLHTTRISNV